MDTTTLLSLPGGLLTRSKLTAQTHTHSRDHSGGRKRGQVNPPSHASRLQNLCLLHLTKTVISRVIHHVHTKTKYQHNRNDNANLIK